MADFAYNIAKGAVAEKFRDAAPNGIMALNTADETEATMKDHDNFSTLYAGASTEASDGSYARKTGQTGTITVDDTNDRVDVDMIDQVFASLAGAAIVSSQIGYEESAAETGRVPLTSHTLAVTPDGSDVTVQVNAAGFFRAS